MMYLGFMDSHKCISLVGDFEDEGGHADVKIKKKFLLSPQFAVNLKLF